MHLFLADREKKKKKEGKMVGARGLAKILATKKNYEIE